MLGTCGLPTLRDMKAYRPNWTQPLSATFGDRQVVASDLPAAGGLAAVEAFRINP